MGKFTKACANGDYDTVLARLDKGNTQAMAKRDRHGFSGLHAAAGNGQTAIVALLLSRNWPTTIKTEGGTMPIHVASNFGRSAVVAVLLSKESERRQQVTAKDSDGRTALHLACMEGHYDVSSRLIIAEALLRNGAKVNAQDNQGYSPLHMACANGYLDVIRLLLKHGADLQLANEEGLLPFQMNNEDEGVQAILKGDA
mmetsp:Transcript_10698/g.39278  ORF Transcript_10698/g.39278 Transcript_10698/m.39278 type:complete len:199 (-) Transcript_10698:103-699(-)